MKNDLPSQGNAPVKLLQVIGNAIVGGMEACVLRLLERLPRERFQVSAMCPFDSPFTERLRALGIDVVIVSMPPEDPPWASIATAAALVRERGIQVLHAHLPNAHVLAGLTGALTGVPVLTTIHARQLQTLDLEVHRLAGSHLAVVCRHTAFHALNLGVAPSHLHLLPNGVDLSLFQPGRVTGGPLRAACGLGADVPLVGFVGRLSAEKGPDQFLRAMQALHPLVPRAQAVLVGDGPMRAELQAQAARAGLRGCVHFAGLRHDVPQVLRELDVVVSTSRSEAMPLALLEAMACGLPVVAMRVGGVPDLIVHERTGFLVGLNDMEGVARHVARLLDDPALAAGFGRAAREHAQRHFSLADGVAATAALFERLAAMPQVALAA
jgi:glycosyltransferase involved in cell wall biosynthesis